MYTCLFLMIEFRTQIYPASSEHKSVSPFEMCSKSFGAHYIVVCGEMCGKIEKLLDWNKNWCGSRY